MPAPTLRMTSLCAALLFSAAASVFATAAQAANPAFAGWYADPEIRIFKNEYWVYPTYSDDDGAPDRSTVFSAGQKWQRSQSKRIYPSFLNHTFFNAFSSPDMVHWTKHSHVIDVKDVDWAAYAVWAPSAVHANGKYYLFFGANDIKDNNQLGGVGVAVSDNPAGPFKDAIGRPLIGQIVNGAQPIDQMVFQDDDGQTYMYYGGWKHCNVVKLSKSLTSLEALPDGSMYKEITPSPDYVEGPFMAKRKGRYYLMWSEGSWVGPDYRVAYAVGDSPLGPFKSMGVILKQDPDVATGAGHHSVVQIPGTDDWYIVYHRRPLGDQNGNHRQVAIEHMVFNEDGTIQPVKLTTTGIEPRPLTKAK